MERSPHPTLTLLSAHCGVDLTVFLYYCPAANNITAMHSLCRRVIVESTERERLTD